ncbi:GGDEF domain-containing protein [Ferrimonas marina]|uniref:diguanylate cyclase n=1 Tax=Ferrimonas marina TaxID=299255 RepID=A0A1M5VSM6_9GAMM|nr:diguanylate cyclase [Ferrimonas marina]SHH77984.1 diguanylate cyclase (GGDEF) domain-containing protein [Ferrimonas marina]
MTLRQVSLVTTLLVVLILLFCYWLVRNAVVLPYVEQQVLAAQRHEINRVQFHLDGRIRQLETVTQELARSDAIIDALAGRTLPPLLTVDIPLLDGVYLFNSALELVSAQHAGDSVSNFLDSQEAYRRARLMPILHPQQPRVRSGLLKLGDKLDFYAAATICRESAEDCGYGYLMLTKGIDEGLGDLLKEGSGLSIEYRAATLADQNLEPMEHPERLSRPMRVRSLLLSDALGQPSVVLTLRHKARPPEAIGKLEWGVYGIIALVGAIVALVQYKILVRPMERGVATIRAMERHQQFRSVNSRAELLEFHQLAKVFNGLMRMLASQEEKMANLTRTDSLTGLPNRRALDDFLDEEWRRLQRHRRGLAILLLDIEQLHQFNEARGYGQGDQALLKLARVLRSLSRRGGEVAARYGGDEFALALTEMDQATLEKLVRAIRTKLAAQALFTEGGLRVNIGAAMIAPGLAPEGLTLTLVDLFAHAEQALYEAKQGQGWALWQPEPQPLEL